MSLLTLSERRTLLGDVLPILTLYSFAVAQPLFALLGEQVGYFTANQYDAPALVVFGLVLGLLFPLLLTGVVLLSRMGGSRIFQISLSLVTGLLWVFILLPLLKWLPGGIALLGAVGVAVLMVRLFWAKPDFQSFLRFAAVAAPAFLLLFLFSSKATPLILKSEQEYSPKVQVDTTQKYPPVVVVFWDELPTNTLLNSDGKIDAIRYPNFAEFATHATWYRNTNSVGASTLWAIPAMLSGQMPSHEEEHTPAQRQSNLFTLLGQTHDFENVVEKHTTLCPKTLCKQGKSKPFKKVFGSLDDLSVVYLHLIVPTDWQEKLPDVSNNWEGFAQKQQHDEGAESTPPKPLSIAERRAAKDRKNLELAVPNHKRNLFLRFIRKIKPYQADTDKPPFYFMHIVFPHVPYNYMPSGKYYSIAAYRYFTTWHDEREIYYDYQRHLLQTGATDELMGHLIARLKEQGLYDKAVIIIAADHGANWGGIGTERRKLQNENHINVMRVPLFIHTPGQTQARVDDRQVLTIDILPTLADILQLPLPGKVDGHSVLAKDYVEANKVRIIDNKGKDWFEFPIPTAAEKAALLRRKIAWFGTGDSARIFSATPFLGGTDQSPLKKLLDCAGDKMALCAGKARGLPEREFVGALHSRPDRRMD